MKTNIHFKTKDEGKTLVSIIVDTADVDDTLTRLEYDTEHVSLNLTPVPKVNEDESMFSSNLERVLTNVMECVHNLHGNYDEVEYLMVAQELKSLETDNLRELNDLQHPEDHEDYDKFYK